MAFAGRPPDVLYEPFRRRFRTYRFLSHLHSLMVTMSQKSSVPQAVKSVSQALMSDPSSLLTTCHPRLPSSRTNWKCSLQQSEQSLVQNISMEGGSRKPL